MFSSSSTGRLWQGLFDKQRSYGRRGKKCLTQFVLRFPLLSMRWHDVKVIQAGMKFWASLSVINSSAFSPARWHVRWLIDFWAEVRTRQAHVERMQTKVTTGWLFTPKEGELTYRSVVNTTTCHRILIIPARLIISSLVRPISIKSTSGIRQAVKRLGCYWDDPKMIGARGW